MYARVSTDAQQKEGTIESQVLELKRQIAAAGDVLVREYARSRYARKQAGAASGVSARGGVSSIADAVAQALQAIPRRDALCDHRVPSAA